MAALNTDLFKKLARRWVGQIGSGGVADNSVTTIPLSSTTNLPTGTAVLVTLDRVSANGTATAALEETVIGVVSGSNLVNCVRGVEGTAQAHNAGGVAEVLVTAKGINDMIDGFLTEHSQLGTHTNITACNVTASGTTTASHVSASDITSRYYTGTGIDTDGTLAANSDLKLSTQKAVKTYVDSQSSSTNGWSTLSSTLAYSSADGHTFVVTSTADVTGTVALGDKIKFTNNSTTFYGFVTKIDASTITLYGGTTYAVANSAITAPSFSHEKSPYGFINDPAIWTDSATSTSNVSQSSPTANTWYNLGSLTIAVPIGKWFLEYLVVQQAAKASSTSTDIYSTLSTANNTQSDADFTSFSFAGGASGNQNVFSNTYKRKVVGVTSKTSYYLNAQTDASSVDSIAHRGDLGTTIIRAVCAYL